MSKLYYTTSTGRHLVKEALMGFATVDKFIELFGEDEIEKAVYDKTDADDFFLGCLSVDD